MKKTAQGLVAALVFMTAIPVANAARETKHLFQPLGTLLSAVACSASAANRTFTLTAEQGKGYGVVALQTNFDYTSGTTVTVTMTCDVSMDAQTTWAQLNGCDVLTDAECTQQAASWVKSTSDADVNYPERVDFLGYPDARCLFACGGTSPVGTITVYGGLVSK